MSGKEVRRLFLALWLGEAVRGALTELQKRLPPGLGRLVAGENLHITLVFLGSTPALRQACIEEALAGIDKPGFNLRLDRLGYWRQPRVLWVGGEITPPPLAALVQALRDAAARCGCEVEARPFQTHLTLCRKVRTMPRDLPAMEPISWPVQSFVLVESVTAADGAVYRILREWMLHPGADGSASR
jgi:2'-5' RNA ligase